MSSCPAYALQIRPLKTQHKAKVVPESCIRKTVYATTNRLTKKVIGPIAPRHSPYQNPLPQSQAVDLPYKR